MKSRIIPILIIVLYIMSGCTSNVMDGRVESIVSQQGESFNYEHWSHAGNLTGLDLLSACEDGDGGIWALNSEHSLTHYSYDLKPIENIVPKDLFVSIYCKDGMLYGVKKDVTNAISVIYEDGTSSTVVTFELDSLENVTISQFVLFSDHWLIRQNDSRLFLADQTGHITHTYNDISSSSIWADATVAYALEYDLATESYFLIKISTGGNTEQLTCDLPIEDGPFQGVVTDNTTLFFSNNHVLECVDSELLPKCGFSVVGDPITLVAQQSRLLIATDQGLYLVVPPDLAETDTTVTRLTLASVDNETVGTECLKIAVQSFNAAHSNIQVDIKNYQQQETNGTATNEKLNLDLAAGEGPDLINTAAFSENTYIRNGTLISLNDMLNTALDLSQYHPNYLSIMEKGQNVYSVLVAYRIKCMMVKNEYIETIDNNFSWTIDGFCEQIDNAPENVCVCPMTPQWFLREWCDTCIDDYIQGSTCDFNSTSFINLLQTANRLSITDSDLYATSLEYLSHVEGYRQYLIEGDESRSSLQDYTILGMPSDRSSGIAMESVLSLGISSTSNHAEACREFICYLLSEEFQKTIENAFPVMTSVLNEQIKNAKRSETHPITETQAGTLLDAVNRCDHLCNSYADIQEIILGEAEAYFSGDKTAEEVAQLIQNRAMIYLAEQQ